MTFDPFAPADEADLVYVNDAMPGITREREGDAWEYRHPDGTVIDTFLGDATQRMHKSVETTHEHFNSVRTGRAAPALLDRIQVDYYGTPTPLKNLATINTPEPRMLTIQP